MNKLLSPPFLSLYLAAIGAVVLNANRERWGSEPWFILTASGVAVLAIAPLRSLFKRRRTKSLPLTTRNPKRVRTIAFVTHTAKPALTSDDQLAADALALRGQHVVAVPWDAPTTDWSAFDAVVIRSTWDYHLRPAEFIAWLGRLERVTARVWNPPAFLRWNADKRYLIDLAGRRVPIVPTRLLPRGKPADLRALLSAPGHGRAVLKPTFAVGAHETWVTDSTRATSDQPRLDAMLAVGDVLIQPFVGAIQTNGEWSLIFFNGRFSHAVQKHPKPGDFRVQVEHGGSVTPATPPAHLIEQAQRILSAITQPLLYARIDGLDLDGTFTLMELEALEPYLFFSASPDAADHFADALLATLDK